MEGRTILQWGLAGLGVALILGYSFFVIDDFVRGPRLIIASPLNGFSTTSPIVLVSGQGIHTNNVTINGAQAPVDLEGNFGEQIILAPGYNAIQIAAKDNYERIVKETIEIVLVVPHQATTTEAALIEEGVTARPQETKTCVTPFDPDTGKPCSTTNR